MAELFEVRIAGPDDVITYDDELVALRNANAVNKQFLNDCLANPDDHVMCVATVHAVEVPNAEITGRTLAQNGTDGA
jgi:hypothetical protein